MENCNIYNDRLRLTPHLVVMLGRIFEPRLSFRSVGFPRNLGFQVGFRILLGRWTHGWIFQVCKSCAFSQKKNDQKAEDPGIQYSMVRII